MSELLTPTPAENAVFYPLQKALADLRKSGLQVDTIQGYKLVDLTEHREPDGNLAAP